MARSRRPISHHFLDVAHEQIRGRFMPQGMHTGGWIPPVDVYHTGDTLTVKMAISGVKREDIDVEYTGTSLRISGVRQDTCEECKEGYYMMEIDYGMFDREIPMPPNVDGKKIEASYREGFLFIKVPIRANTGEKSREIEIQ